MAEEREVFQRQPGNSSKNTYLSIHLLIYCIVLAARAVLIDFTPPITLDTLTNIQQSLSNTLSLLNHLSGGHVRVPYISFIVLGNYPEVRSISLI